MKILLILLALAAHCLAANIGLKWNPNPPDDQVTKYTVTATTPGPDGNPIVLTRDAVATEAGGEVPVRVSFEGLTEGLTYTFTVKAFNEFGESEPSDPVVYTVPKKPSKPGGLEVVEIQTSSNLTEWKPLAYVPLKTDDAARFVRARITTVTPNP